LVVLATKWMNSLILKCFAFICSEWVPIGIILCCCCAHVRDMEGKKMLLKMVSLILLDLFSCGPPTLIVLVKK
jgi:hypothetical protein